MLLETIIAGKAIMDTGIAAYPLHWKIWINILGITNLAAIFFIKKREAQVALLIMILTFPIMLYLAGTFGFVRLLGAGHILWIPMIIFLFKRYKKIPAETYYGKWVRLLMIVVSISLIIDTIDVIRYFIGV